jgi:cell division protease FtsH
MSSFGGRPKLSDRVTRKPLAPWDRIKFLFLLTVIWFILTWSVMANDPIVGFADSARIEVRTGFWVFILLGLELLRQIHFVISEHSRSYHRFWQWLIFGGFERLTHRTLSDWTRYRLRRLFTWVFWIVVVAVVVGKIIHTTPLLALLLGPQLVWHLMPFAIQIIFLISMFAAQFGLLFWLLSRGGVDVYYPDDIETRFADVWGQDHVLERVKENIIFLENPELVEAHGGHVPGGILLWGPPGTGKTLMAEAVAGETGKPYVFVDPGAFINMFMGVGILKVKALFRKLRRLALRYGGVIVFFDEADSLGNRGIAVGGQLGGPRGSSAPFAHTGCHGFSYLSRETRWRLMESAMAGGAPEEKGEEASTTVFRQIIGAGMNGGGGGGMGTLQSLLTEISGLKKPRGFVNRHVRKIFGMRPKPPPHYRILVMMATNMASALDPALLRPGRIDRIYKVGYPSKAGRVRTYEGYLAKVSHELTAEQIDKIATTTPYATGASIKDLVNESLICAIRDGRDVITWPDVVRAKHLKDLGPPENVEYIERERHSVAIHEACHAVVAYTTMHHMEIDLATIEKHGDTGGMVVPIPPEDQFIQWRSDYEADILTSLASLAGERMFFGNDSTSGVSGDLESATSVASYMEGYWGMGSTVTSYSTAQRLVGGVGRGRAAPAQGEDAETKMKAALGDRIEDNLARLMEQAESILRDHRNHVLALAHALETHKTLSGEDVDAVFTGRQGPLVDGRPYADEDFMQAVSDYHEAVVRAHADHNRSEQVGLPQPPRPAEAWELNGNGAAGSAPAALGGWTGEEPGASSGNGNPPGWPGNGNSPDWSGNSSPSDRGSETCTAAMPAPRRQRDDAGCWKACGRR